MASEEHLKIIRQGVKIWNKWRLERDQQGFFEADLSGADLRGASLRGADLRKANLRKANLSGADLWEANFSDADLRRATLSHAKLFDVGTILRKAILRKANLRESDFSGANLSGADLSGADLSKANLSGANLNNAFLHDADLTGADLSRTDLRHIYLNSAHLSGANLSFTNLSHVNLSKKNLRNANLSGARFSNTDIGGADLSGADLSNANFSGANLNNANFSDANLSCVDLSKKNLSDAKLGGANLEGANLVSITLIEANLCKAVLKNANLSDANLRRANCEQADLTEANLRQARMSCINLNGANLTGIHLWETQRAGWSIKNVICEYAYLEDNDKKTYFAPGEFERLFSDKTRIRLLYKDGINPLEIATLPALIQNLETTNNGEFQLRLHSIEDTSGGAVVTLVLEPQIEQNPEQLEELKKVIESEWEQKSRWLRKEIENENLILRGEVRALERQINSLFSKPTFYLEQGNITSDTYNISGQAGAVGPNAYAQDNTFNQIGNQIARSVDMNELAAELLKLREAMKNEAAEPDHYIAIGQIAEAEKAAQKNDSWAAAEKLKAAGSWALKVAADIGTKVAAKAIGQAIGTE